MSTETKTRKNSRRPPALVIPADGEMSQGPEFIDQVGETTNGHHLPAACSVEIEVVKLPIGTLLSAGREYQREIDWKRVERLVERFRLQSVGTLLINERPDGNRYIVDGQHRKEALEKLYGPEFAWWCFLIHVEGPAQEATIFVEVNAEHSRPAPGILFQGRLIRGEPAALEVEKIVLEQGMSLHLSSGREGANELPTSVLDDIHRKWGAERLREILKFARETWDGQKGFSSSAVVSGVATFYHHYGEHKAFDPDRISKTLKEFQVQYVYREAKIVAGREFSHRHVAFASAMAQLYNSHCESPSHRIARKKEKPQKKAM